MAVLPAWIFRLALARLTRMVCLLHARQGVTRLVARFARPALQVNIAPPLELPRLHAQLAAIPLVVPPPAFLARVDSSALH
jgi:hypothetical protein